MRWRISLYLLVLIILSNLVLSEEIFPGMGVVKSGNSEGVVSPPTQGEEVFVREISQEEYLQPPEPEPIEKIDLEEKKEFTEENLEEEIIENEREVPEYNYVFFTWFLLLFILFTMYLLWHKYLRKTI